MNVVRISHTEWFKSVLHRGRTSCPNCSMKLDKGEKIWSWGQVIQGNWSTNLHFCKRCFREQIVPHLIRHVHCGCSVRLVAFNREILPEWLSVGDQLNINIA